MFDESDLQFDSSEIDPPGDSDKFEVFCCDLIRKIWKDPTAQRVGRSGQSQYGVDILARPEMGIDFWGLQCKEKDKLKGKLVEKEIRDEVEAAKGFNQPLKHFVIVTTLDRNEKLQEIANRITVENKKNGLFSLAIWGWQDIREYLMKHKDIFYLYWPQYRRPSETINDPRIDVITKNTEKILENQTEKEEIVNKNYGSSTINAATEDLPTSPPKYLMHTKIDNTRELIEAGNPLTALKELERIKKDNWSILDNILKFRIITNIAAAEAKIGDEENAAKHFIEALQYNPEDEKALCNAATGYLIQEDKIKAREMINKILKLNPASDRGYSLKIYSNDENVSIDETIKGIPEINLNSVTVLNTIGDIFRKKEEYDKAVTWLRKANRKDPEDAETGALLAETILHTVVKDQTFIFGGQSTKEIKQKLEEVDSLLKKSWDKVSNKEIKKFHYSWLANRSLANQFLKNYEVALRNIEEALELKPNDPDLIKQKAILLFDSNKKDEAITLIKTIKNYDSKPEISIPLVGLLASNKSYDEAIEILNRLKKNTTDEYALSESNRMLIDLFIQTKRTKEAETLSDKLLREEPNNVSHYIDRAHLYFALEDNKSAGFYLKRAKEKINEKTQPRELIDLGNAFYNLGEFIDASDIFEKVADLASDSELTRKLLNSYYRAGKLGEALRVVKELKQSQGPIRYLIDLESSIYEEIGDWEKAKNVCQEYLQINPNDKEIQIKHAVVLLQSGKQENLEELDRFLDKTMDASQLSFDFWQQIISLYEARGLTIKALENAYELRRKFFNKPEAHLQYVGLFFRTEKENNAIFDNSEVKNGSAVLIENGPEGQWYILDQRQDADLGKNEINKSHPLFNLLIGKKVGDSFILGENAPIPQKITIKEIKQKYVYALHNSLNNFNSLFPTAEGLWGFKVEIPQKIEGNNPPEGLKIILDQVSKQDDFIHQVEKYYREGKLTLGAASTLIGKDILTTWGGFISKGGPGLKSSAGTIEERKNSILALRSSPRPKLIIDPISIMTIHGIGIAEKINRYFGKIGVPASTVDLFQRNIINKRGLGSQGYMSVGKEGNKFIRTEITEEEIQKNIKYIESIIKWIEEECEILPCSPALEVERNVKIKNEKLLGKESFETILIASCPGNILYSDDERLRSLAKGSHKCEGVWTQLLMMEMLDKQALTNEEYTKAVIKLIKSNYYHTSINKEIIYEAVKQSSWEIKEPFTEIANKLQEGDSDLRSAVNVASEFIEKIINSSDEAISQEKKTAIVKYIIDILVKNRPLTEVIEGIKNELEKIFIKNPTGKEKAMVVIRAWAKEKGFEFGI